MVTVSLWVGLKVAMATLNGRSQPNGISIPVGGAKGYHGNTRGRSQALLVTASLWAGLKATMATLKGQSQPYGISIPVGGAKGHHGHTKMGGAKPYW